MIVSFDWVRLRLRLVPCSFHGCLSVHYRHKHQTVYSGCRPWKTSVGKKSLKNFKEKVMYRFSGILKHTQSSCKRVLCRLVLRKTLKDGHINIEPFRCASSAIDSLFPSHHVFAERHIGPNEDEKKAMLEFIGMEVIIVYLFAKSLFIVAWHFHSDKYKQVKKKKKKKGADPGNFSKGWLQLSSNIIVK